MNPHLRVASAFPVAPALPVALGFLAGASILRADFKRRRFPTSAVWTTIFACLAGLIGAHLYSLLAGPTEFLSPSLPNFGGLDWFGGLIGGLAAAAIVARRAKIPVLEFLDACSPAAAAAYAVGRAGSATGSAELEPLYECFAWLAIAAFLWHMGTKALRGPKARGEIFCDYVLLTGLARFLGEFTRAAPRPIFGLSQAQAASLVVILAGGLLLWRVKSRFHGTKKEHRIIEYAASRGEAVQLEYHRATPECPHPERWHMYDSMSAEVETLDFLKALVIAIKPDLVVETGTFMGISTLRIAEGLKENGFGRVITCECDPKVFETARQRFGASGLAPWIEARNESSLQTKIEGRIDLLFCDSDPPLREQEVRRFLPQVNSHGLILMHDSSSALKTVREAALRLEAEGLLSVLLLPTPRGLVVAQKREGRV